MPEGGNRTSAEGTVPGRAEGSEVAAPLRTTVNVGILGCGHVSPLYFVGLAYHEHLNVACCADVDLQRARQRADEFDIPTPCSPQEMFENDEVEIVVNLTPPGHHEEMTHAGIAHGKHVYSEKPLALSNGGAKSLVNAASTAGVLLGCAPDTFLGGGLQTCRKLIDDGWIGTPVAAAAFVTSHGYEHFHPNVEAFYQPGGGPMLDVGPYYVTALVSLFGPITAVTGVARQFSTERRYLLPERNGDLIPVGVPTHVAGTIEFASGPIVTLITSWEIWVTRLPYIEVYGTEGSLSAPNPDEFGGAPLVRRASKEELLEPLLPPGTAEWAAVPLTHDDGVSRGVGVADLANALSSGSPHRASGQLARHVLEALLAFERSSAEGRRVAMETTCERPAPLPVTLGPAHQGSAISTDAQVLGPRSDSVAVAR